MTSLPPEFPGIYAAREVFDVVVIGAGINGSATAYYCSKSGLKTLLLEQFSLPHTRGSSTGQSRVLCYRHRQPYYHQMLLDAFPMWVTLEKETNTDLYRNTGILTISALPDGKYYSETLVNLQESRRSYRLLEAEDLRCDYPQIKVDSSTRGILEYDGGTLMANKALQSFQTEFVKQGGILQDEERMLEIIPGTTVTVKTNRGEYKARSVVLTPGPWASKVLSPLGLYPPLKTVRINVPYWREKQEGSMERVPTFIIDLPGGEAAYGLQPYEYPGLVKFCYHDGCEAVDPDHRDNVPQGKKRDIEILQECISKYIPTLESEPAIMETCMYTVTPDEDFILDTHPVYPNIVIGCGFSGIGFKFAPTTGKILCHLAMGRKPHMDIKAFSFRRFKNSCLKSLPKL